MSDSAAFKPQTPGQFIEAAYAQHAAACVLYAQQVVGARLADDACQEAFVRLFRLLVRGGERPRAPRAWLLKATRSAALDLLRSEKRRIRREEAAGVREAFAPDPAAALDSQELSAALATLPPRQRETVVLRIWGEMGFTEIAQMLDVVVSTAHGDYSAGLRALRETLDPKKNAAVASKG